MGKTSKILFLLAGISFVSFVIVRFLLGTWVPYLWVALGLFVFFIILGLWVDRAVISEFMSMKTTKQGLSMGTMIALVLILMAAINFLGVRRYKTFDFSMSQSNTLSDQSIKLVKSLDSDLKVIYFYKKGNEGVDQLKRAFIELMRKYQDQSPNVKLEFVEVNERPDLAQVYEVKKGTQVVFLEYKGRKNKIEKVDEQEITSALVKVTRQSDKNIYILSGHGEISTKEEADGSGAAYLKHLLEGNRYNLKELSFTTAATVPDDADMLLILGPTQDFLEIEINAVESYLKKGGSLILAIEPLKANVLKGLVQKMGVKVDDNYVVTVLQTPFGNAVDPRMTRGSDFSAANSITKPFGNSQFVVFKLPTSLSRVSPAPQGLVLEDIVKSGKDAMAFSDTNFTKDGKSGPFTFVTTVKGKWAGGEKEFSSIILGDSELFNDQYLTKNLNRDLVLNAISYLAKEENLISITPKEVAKTDINLTQTQFFLYIVLFIIPLPLLLLLTSGFLWYRRRYS